VFQYRWYNFHRCIRWGERNPRGELAWENRVSTTVKVPEKMGFDGAEQKYQLKG